MPSSLSDSGTNSYRIHTYALSGILIRRTVSENQPNLITGNLFEFKSIGKIEVSWLGLGAADLGYAADGLDSEKIPFLHNRSLAPRAFHLFSNPPWCRRAYISLGRFSHSIFFHETRLAMPRLITL